MFDRKIPHSNHSRWCRFGTLTIFEKPELGIVYDPGLWKKETMYWTSKK